jgi:hypothetical protein
MMGIVIGNNMNGEKGWQGHQEGHWRTVATTRALGGIKKYFFFFFFFWGNKGQRCQ